MIHAPTQALAFVRKHGIVTMTASGRPSLVEAIAGGPVRGSWWGHPKGKVIFRLAESLHDSPDVLTAKLIGGKVTFLHRERWPALARLVMDPERRRESLARLDPAARRLLRRVDRLGTLRLDQAGMKVRKELESSLLVHSGSMHTEKGSHATVLTSWGRTFDSETLARARKLSLEEARGLLGL